MAKAQQLTTRVTDAERKAVEAAAERRGQSVSDFVRGAVFREAFVATVTAQPIADAER